MGNDNFFVGNKFTYIAYNRDGIMPLTIWGYEVFTKRKELSSKKNWTKIKLGGQWESTTYKGQIIINHIKRSWDDVKEKQEQVYE